MFTTKPKLHNNNGSNNNYDSSNSNQKDFEVPTQASYFSQLFQSRPPNDNNMVNDNDNDNDNNTNSENDNASVSTLDPNNYDNKDDDMHNNENEIKHEIPEIVNENPNIRSQYEQPVVNINHENENDEINILGINNVIEVDQDSDNDNDTENNSMNNENEEHNYQSWIQNTLYSTIYHHLKKLADHHGVKISVPEILFFGFQSSGKTSTVAAMIRNITGVMQNGTGNYCPVRFIMSNNNNVKIPKFYVNNKEMKNQQEQIETVITCMQKLKEKNEFTTNVLELRIESCDIPNLVFIDMPGLIKKDNEKKYQDWKNRLNYITKQFLSEKSNDGITYKYIPVFVKECMDNLNDNDDDIKYIDTLLNDSRPNWKNDTLFVLNKFDKNCNYEKASDYIDYIKTLQKYGETVLTVSNPEDVNPTQLSLPDLQIYYKNAIEKEEQWWQRKIINPLRNKNDFQCDQLIKLKKKIVVLNY